MTTTLKISSFFVLGCLLLAAQNAHGQSNQAGVPNQLSSGYSTPVIQTPAMRYFGQGLHRNVTRSQARPQTQARPQRMPTQRFQLAGEKPFQNIDRRPAISPYLGLDMLETSVGLPNYYSRVLPQIQQQEARQAQAIEMRRQQQQARLANVPRAISNNRGGGVANLGGGPQFMNKGSYFPPIRR